MKIEYTLYQWEGNKLLSETAISFPYDKYGNVNIDFATKADCLTIRRTHIKPYSTTSAIIEELYR